MPSTGLARERLEVFSRADDFERSAPDATRPRYHARSRSNLQRGPALPCVEAHHLLLRRAKVPGAWRRKSRLDVGRRARAASCSPPHPSTVRLAFIEGPGDVPSALAPRHLGCVRFADAVR